MQRLRKHTNMRRFHFTHTLIAFCGTLLLFVVFFGGGAALAMLSQHSTSELSAATVIPFEIARMPQLTAKAAIVYDPADGRVLYEKNAMTQLPLASLTKLMTAEIVLTTESPDTPVRITASDLALQDSWGLAAGDTLPLHDLLKLGLIASSNNAMQAAAESLGNDYLQKMNDVAQNLGLAQTYFLNPTGLDVNSDTSGAYGSAYDVARLAALFYKQYPSYFELTQNDRVSISVGGRTVTAHATAAPLLSISGFIGAKTGYTDLAGGNLVALFDVEVGHPLVAVVLGSTQTGRFDDIRTLVNAAHGQ